jgi:predicted RNase H-like HicB family nuclease
MEKWPLPFQAMWVRSEVPVMHNEFTAIIEQDEDWFIAYCPEIPGANGEGRTIEECRKNLADAIELILEDRREDAFRGVPPDAFAKLK